MSRLYHSFLLLSLLVCSNIYGQLNYSLSFNGTNNYVEFPFVEHHDLFDDFSIELWLKYDSSAVGRILTKVIWFEPGDSTASYSIYFDEVYPDRVIFSTFVSQFPIVEHKAISTIPLSSNQWQHIAVTYIGENSIKNIYIDGFLAFSEANTGGIGYNGRPLFIGAFKTNLGEIIYPFKGQIDEIIIWNKALSKEEIIFNINNPVIGNEDSLVGLWHFNEGLGDTIYDSSSFDVIGMNHGATWDDGFILTSVNENEPNKIRFDLFQNYPNPFNPSSKINYRIPELSYVTLKVYDVLGNEISSLVNEEKPTGTYAVEFNAIGLPSGIYFYRLQAGSFVETKKMVLLK